MTALLSVERLCLRLGGRDVLAGVDLNLPRGTFCGLVGANGAGKSCLLRCVATLLRGFEGHIAVDGHDVVRAGMQARTALGYAVDPALLPAVLDGSQCLQLFAESRGLSRPDAAALEFAERLDLARWLDRPVGTYSFGMRQKLAIVLAIVGGPPLVLLDEVMNGLDPVAAVECRDHLRGLAASGACSVLLATHGIDFAAAAFDRVVVIEGGRVAADWDDAVLRRVRAEGGVEAAVVARLRAARAAATPPPASAGR
ncbi:ABC transporter ATP-binding protein [Coralloluteibacterium thermophilus]|uniref:ABC transporter ATP-binding protein n=1 Tax=Coralloluteibacterium thermophilum TaxID=2707049 RepID=A0ABV9NK17_9GAMM